MQLESNEDAVRLAQQMLARDAKITDLANELQTRGMLGLECATAGKLEALSAENAVAAGILARWFLAHPLQPGPLEKPQIHLVLERPDGPPASVKISGCHVTPPMLGAAEDLLHTILTGERLLLKNLYEVLARAFDTTREDAKRRFIFACYGGKGAPGTPQRRIDWNDLDW